MSLGSGPMTCRFTRHMPPEPPNYAERRVEGQQGDQRVFRRRAEPGGDQQRAELVAVQSGGVGFAVQARPANMRGGRVIEEFFLDRVPVEPGDGAQPAGDGGPGTAAGFQIAAEELDVGAAGLEQAERRCQLGWSLAV